MRSTLLVPLILLSGLGAQLAPRPQSVRAVGTADAVCGGTEIWCASPRFRPQAEAFAIALRQLGAADAAVVAADRKSVGIELRATTADGAPAETARRSGYRITPRGKRLVVQAATTTGAAHALASLAQSAKITARTATWPSQEIRDAPDRPFRCFMIDMGRNPHRPATLRQVVDSCWFYKVNYLHLHLSDDQLCSWPSKIYPKIYSPRAGWTWQDFVDLEAYSQARGVTIIPEIDVPGHSSILRRHYPEVFGKTPAELASHPAALRGLQALWKEILSVFRSTPYAHVGGDEAYGVPGDVQRDFINRQNAFLRALGKTTLVWEGPRLGKGPHKVSTDVIHMNWRTVDFPAQQMLDSGYRVINAAWDPLYIVDHYPRTMFTAVDVQRCYEFDIRRFAHVNHGMPTFKTPHRTKTDQGLLGFCMPWWEGREENLLGLCVPRLAATAAATWNRRGESDFQDFRNRQRTLLPRLEKIAGFAFPRVAPNPAGQEQNLAFGGMVTPNRGAFQPVFGPDRLTNGRPERFDHFLGFPTQPDPLEIVIALPRPGEVGRVVIHETAVGKSHELYELWVSADGKTFEQVGATTKDSRGKEAFVTHRFAPRTVHSIKIRTRGCHGLTFPSFSRLTEVQAFAK